MSEEFASRLEWALVPSPGGQVRSLNGIQNTSLVTHSYPDASGVVLTSCV
jgi:hypothetical protein